MGVYAALGIGVGIAARRRRDRVDPLGLMDLLVYGLATEHLSRVITKDSVTAPVRAPFTAFEEASGEGEVEEKVVGEGIRHAVGDLVTCPFCMAQWVATALVAGRVLAPAVTTAVVSLSAIARVSDFLQLAYAHVKEAA